MTLVRLFWNKKLKSNLEEAWYVKELEKVLRAVHSLPWANYRDQSISQGNFRIRCSEKTHRIKSVNWSSIMVKNNLGSSHAMIPIFLFTRMTCKRRWLIHSLSRIKVSFISLSWSSGWSTIWGSWRLIRRLSIFL